MQSNASALDTDRRFDLFAKETAPDFDEAIRRIGDEKSVRCLCPVFWSSSFLKLRLHFFSRFLRGIHQAHATAQNLRMRFFQQADNVCSRESMYRCRFV